MKLDKMQYIMRLYNIARPMRGTGRGGAVIKQDLEDAIGDNFYNEAFGDDLNSEAAQHMKLRRMVRPMKAYRFTELKAPEQDAIFRDDSGWVAEIKHDGWRMMATHIPGQRLHFFGGNLSTVTFMPNDYTHHLPEQRIEHPEPLILDMEALCYNQVIQENGFPSTNTREAVAAILGSGVDVAIEKQLSATVEFAVFDAIQVKPATLAKRQNLFDVIDFAGTDIEVIQSIHDDKKRYLNKIWKTGGEGIILKNLSAPYDSGGRKRTHCIKVKKAASGLIGDNIDAFISGYIQTDVHSYNDLLGGVELSVYINDEPHVIATITNMPDFIRYAWTTIEKGLPVLNKEVYGKVLEIDGQELSTRNKKLMHAKVVNWEFRMDKSQHDCILEDEEQERF